MQVEVTTIHLMTHLHIGVFIAQGRGFTARLEASAEPGSIIRTAGSIEGLTPFTIHIAATTLSEGLAVADLEELRTWIVCTVLAQWAIEDSPPMCTVVRTMALQQAVTRTTAADAAVQCERLLAKAIAIHEPIPRVLLVAQE